MLSRHPHPFWKALLIASFLGVLAQTPVRGQEAGWYHVELEGGESFPARLVSVEGEYYLLNFEGAVLRVSKKSLRKLERISPHGSGAAVPQGGRKAKATARDSDPGAPLAQSGSKPKGDEPLRDALEALSSPDDEDSSRAYKVLQADFVAARPLLHTALRHQSARVRRLSVKLLGEKGTAREDLTAVASRLKDGRPEVRLAAIMAIRLLGPEGLAPLVEHLEAESVPNNRKMTVKTFARWREKRAVAPLADRLGRETDEGVRSFIYDALGAITGQNLGADAAAWSAYLGQLRRQPGVEQGNLPGNQPSKQPGKQPGKQQGKKKS